MTPSILMPWLALSMLTGSPSQMSVTPDATIVMEQDQVAQDRVDLSDLWLTYGDDEGRALTNIDAQGRSLMFMCLAGSQKVLVAHSILTADQTSVSLASGGHRSIHDVVAEAGEMEDGERRSVFTTLDMDEPVIRSFRETGQIEVTANSETVPAVVLPDMKPTVEGFFNSCGSR